MRIALFKDSRESFIQALDGAGVAYEELRAPPGQVMAAGTMIAVAQTAAVAGPIAAVLVAWLKARASRKVILTLHDKRIVHLEGYSVEQVKELLPLVDHGTAIDTKPPAAGAT
ncbi:effector-associated constant component EACC1 [Immundisolibacter cernigliae]|uniref:Uncharacterized protein n=1 Tax=Immundisolibacter cernigliae TaxID=1810504 RepID=A0A1B1YR55_9GAMM|nr:hypothetical protein [Immundisolibacter cernigliae]ANX03266.1 hypothetical protein PG2T_03035 [Immundisolibacter cernigliae]